MDMTLNYTIFKHKIPLKKITVNKGKHNGNKWIQAIN